MGFFNRFKKQNQDKKETKEENMQDKWAEFDGITEGTIQTMDSPMIGVKVITVEYIVDGEEYLMQNVVQMQNGPRRMSAYPPLEKGIPKLESVEPGTKVRVGYKTASPEEAYLPDNQ